MPYRGRQLETLLFVMVAGALSWSAAGADTRFCFAPGQVVEEEEPSSRFRSPLCSSPEMTTPLFYAAMKGHTGTVRLLLNNRIDYNQARSLPVSRNHN